MKIGIVGSGISGLAAAHRLKDRAELTLFEADRRTGGHANTVVVESERGFESVDTGFIVFNDRNYPEFSSILEEIEVASRPSSMSFSYSDGDFEYAGRDLNGLFARRRNLVDPGYLRMLAEFTRFQRSLRELALSGESGPSLEEFLAEHRFSTALRERVVVPLVAAVWSADPGQMSSFPVGFPGALSRQPRSARAHATDRAGARSKAARGSTWKRSTAPIRDRVRTSTPVAQIRRFEDHVEVIPEGGGPERFDEVIIATHSDQALDDAVRSEPGRAGTARLDRLPGQPHRAPLGRVRDATPSRRLGLLELPGRPRTAPGRRLSPTT